MASHLTLRYIYRRGPYKYSGDAVKHVFVDYLSNTQNISNVFVDYL